MKSLFSVLILFLPPLIWGQGAVVFRNTFSVDPRELSRTYTEFDLDFHLGPRQWTRMIRLYDSLTLEQKIGQLFAPHIRYTEGWGSMKHLDAAAKELLRVVQPGTIVLFNENLESKAQLEELVEETQQTVEVPLFWAIDEEGGAVSRFGSSPLAGGQRFASPMDQGRLGTDGTRETMKAVAEALGSIGVHINFAPVADLANPDQSDLWQSRSYGYTPDEVSLLVEVAVEALQDNGVMAVLKHFPGHGATSLDSHFSISVLDRTMEQMRDLDLVPFRSGVGAGAGGIMMGHLFVPGSLEQKPATINKEFYRMGREDLQFRGLFFTDALEMEGLREHIDEDEAVVEAVLAGANQLVMPLNPISAHGALVQAYGEQRITEDVLRERVLRVLAFKTIYGVLE